ncbi:MAG TPA: hypothetical protein VED41_03910 [Solirubrobacteraceae bacterium]|nr:hypothetical protein [Solirubrobacteraceae bacterium]
MVAPTVPIAVSQSGKLEPPGRVLAATNPACDIQSTAEKSPRPHFAVIFRTGAASVSTAVAARLAGMIDRPGPLGQLDGYFAAARIAHEYVADLHRELVELDAADDHTRELLRESAALVFERMRELTNRLRGLESEWAEQELLDPPAAERTIECMEVEFAKQVPALTALRARQNQIAAELLDLASQAR